MGIEIVSLLATPLFLDRCPDASVKDSGESFVVAVIRVDEGVDPIPTIQSMEYLYTPEPSGQHTPKCTQMDGGADE